MRLLLLFLFLAYPMLELALLIKLGGVLGAWSVFGIILVTAAAGVLVLRHHGLAFFRRMTEAMAEGRPPAETVFDSALVGTAGMMLIAPGLITDALGLLMLVPPLRRLIIKWASRFFLVGGSPPFSRAQHSGERPDMDATSADTHRHDEHPFGRQRRGRREPIVIDGEYERIDESVADPRKTSDRDKDPKEDR